ncbi:hypothetical protein ES703_34981 [subsurface metagenome]
MEQLREARRAQQLEGHAVYPVLLRQGAHALQGLHPHGAGPVGGSHDGVVQGVDNVAAGIVALDLQDDVGSYLLRGDEFHLPDGGDALKLRQGKSAVLPGIYIDTLQVSAQGVPVAAVLEAEGAVQHHGLLGGTVHQLDGPVPFFYDAVIDGLPGDGGRRLDLLGDGRVRCAAHEEQQHGVRTRQRRLGQQHPGGLLFTVGVGDVQPHAPRAAGADLDVYLGIVLDHTGIQDLDVPDNLGGVEGRHEFFHLGQKFSGEGILVASGGQLFLYHVVAVVNVLVGQPRDRVHGIDDDVGPVAVDDLAQGGVLHNVVVQRLHDIGDEEGPVPGIVEDFIPGKVLQPVPDEDVAPYRRAAHIGGFLLHLLDSGSGFFFGHGGDDHLRRPLFSQIAVHRHAYHAVAAQDQDFSVVNVHMLRPFDWFVMYHLNSRFVCRLLPKSGCWL